MDDRGWTRLGLWTGALVLAPGVVMLAQEHLRLLVELAVIAVVIVLAVAPFVLLYGVLTAVLGPSRGPRTPGQQTARRVTGGLLGPALVVGALISLDDD